MRLPNNSRYPFSVMVGLLLLYTPLQARADIVHADDVIIQFSLCVGIDCVNNENFGFDTIRLKENNLRIKFDDTSNSGSFPANDWEITINDSSNGGASYFAVTDVTNGKVPFRVVASAPTNSIYVKSNGNIGFGTSNPAVQLQVTDGNTPTLRLDQDNSSGFTAQTWDVAGNEANFFVRDATHGSKLPFKIKPNAPDNSLVIDAEGDVGVGILSPDSTAAMQIYRTDGGSKLIIQEANGSTESRELLALQNNGSITVTMDNTAGLAWNMGTDASDRFYVDTGGDNSELLLDEQGDLTITGGYNTSSSRKVKENFADVDPQEVLAKVLELPVLLWNYRSNDPTVRHMGPMAEDFMAAFGLGNDDSHINLMDAAGVAFAAIQGLHAQLEERQLQIDELTQEVANLKQKLDEKDRQLNSFNTRLQRLEALLDVR